MITITIICLVIIGVLFLVVFLYRTNSNNHLQTSQTIEWAIFTSFSEIIIFSKYGGEIRFGPTFIHLKNEPNNVFKNDFFGDWFYRTENGVYLQKWNFNPLVNPNPSRPSSDLIYYDRLTNKTEVIETGIHSFHWKIEQNKKNELLLISGYGKKEKRLKIENT